VVDRIKVDQVIKELKLDAAALRDPANWAAVGKAADAAYLLTGSLAVVPMAERPLTLSISLTARVTSLETGRAIAGDGVDFIFVNGQPPAAMPPPAAPPPPKPPAGK